MFSEKYGERKMLKPYNTYTHSYTYRNVCMYTSDLGMKCYVLFNHHDEQIKVV